MADTMQWRVIPGVIALAVHTDQEPTDEDFDELVAELVRNIRSVKGVLIYTQEAGPSAAQRARISEAFTKAGASDFLMVIMSGSRVVRGMVTAFSWAMSGNVRAFSSHDFDGAIACFELSQDDVFKVRAVFKQLARSANTKIDAFADESGQFKKKYGL